MSNVYPGLRVLLMGASGSGKTHSLRTLAAAGIETFCILTEPHARHILADVPDEKLHWAYIPPSTSGWKEMIERANIMTKMSWKALSGMTEDAHKASYNSFWRMLGLIENFKCDRCGKEFGDATEWPASRALVIDSLTGLNQMAMQMVTGESIAKSQPQWGAAMNAELSLVNKIAYDAKAHFILIAHLDREVDQVTGASVIQPLALGRKVAPELPKNFSDVIMAQRIGTSFVWSTIFPQADLKATHAPLSDKLPPDFGPLIATWKSRGGIISPKTEAA